ncbi:MAG: sodium-dependent transporter [Candidatus Aminicenantales bacterium]
MTQREQFGSRWGFICAAIGMAVGTGNIWRFPRMAAQFGGGAFVLAYTAALFLWSAPILMAEMSMGRTTRMGPIGGFREFIGKKYTWMGGWMVVVCICIACYYSVVTGWCVKYFVLALQGAFKEGADTAAIWNSFLHSPLENLLFHFISIGICGFIIYKGIRGGVEKAAKILVPSLFLFLIVAALRAVTLPGAKEGLRYLFVPDWAMLAKPVTWLQAFTQSAWSTGAAWGLLFTYAIYTRKKEDISQNCLIIGFGDQTVALLAGLAVIPTLFALAPNLETARAAVTGSNTGLTFISLAQLFPKMMGGFIIAPIFFLAMVFAAVSSLIAMVELGARTFMDAGLSRKKSTFITAAGCFIFGIPSAVFPSFNDNQDWVWGVALLLSGFFVIFAVWKYGAEKMRTEIINPSADIRMGPWWSLIIKYISPVVFLVVTGWWLVKNIVENPGTWWQPFQAMTVGTIIFQWGLMIILLVLANNFLSKWTRPAEKEEE